MKNAASREATDFEPSSEAVEEYLASTAPIPFLGDEPALVRSPLGVAQLLWRNRRYLSKVAVLALLVSTIVAFLIPKKYQSSTSLMPPDTRSISSAALASLAPEASDTFGTYASTVLGLKSSGALFISILQSRTVQNRIIERFDLRKLYRVSRWQDARRVLTENTGVAEDRKSGVITIVVIDRDPHRAEAMAHSYVEELNRVVAERTTSAAHRERVFLEERLQAIKADLDSAAEELSEFSSKNTALDIPTQVKSMVEALATLEGQAIAARSELRGLQQIYTSNNVRVHAAQARIGELEKQIAKLEGRKGKTLRRAEAQGRA
jgi:capsule polysaccharide export protein KpsE/RkpR